MRNHHLLIQRKKTYYFRQRVLSDLQALLRKHEIIKSLKTQDEKEAIKEHRKLAIVIEEFFAETRATGYVSVPEILKVEKKVRQMSSARIPLLSDALESWAKGSDSKQTTIKEAKRYVGCFIDITGDLPIDQYTLAHARSFRDCLLRQPKGKLGKYPDI